MSLSSPMLRIEWSVPGGNQYGGARPDLFHLLANSHGAPTLNDHVHLLPSVMGMDGLLAARLALYPGDGQVFGSELAGSQKQVRNLAAAMILRTPVQSLYVHQQDLISVSGVRCVCPIRFPVRACPWRVEWTACSLPGSPSTQVTASKCLGGVGSELAGREAKSRCDT